MADVLIRDVPEEVIGAIDAHAGALGLSRNEYLRRQLRRDARHHRSPVSLADLERFTARFSDLTDPEVMTRAWS